MEEEWNVYVAGVGGQGLMLFSQILADAAVRRGIRVLVSEVHGGAQRGGAVGSHLRFGPRVHSPIIPAREAHVLVGMEPLETVRAASRFLRRGGLVLVNSERSLPLAVLVGREKYPPLEELLDYLYQLTPRVVVVPATQVAEGIGRRVLTNVVLLGALSGLRALPFSSDDLRQALLSNVPPGSGPLNEKAFLAGEELVASVSGMQEGKQGCR